MIELREANGTLIQEIIPDDSSVRHRSIMRDDSLTLNFSATEPISVPVGSYVVYQSQRYTLYYPENFTKHNTRNFEYTLVLHGHREGLKLYRYKDISGLTFRLKFPLTATPEEFLQLLVDNMNLHDSGWSVGSCIEADERLISFNHESCFDALGRIADEFDTEWEVVEKTISLHKVEKFKADPLSLSYGKGNGFKSGVARQNAGDSQPIGRLYVQGGDRNIVFDDYGSEHLLLPISQTLSYEGKTYRVDAAGISITRDGNNLPAEGSFDGSEFYPSRVGKVSAVEVIDAEENFYDIIDQDIPEELDYSACTVPGLKPVIAFFSGPLAGREFEIDADKNTGALTGYVHGEGRFKIVPDNIDGVVMPGGVFVPEKGNKYAIFNISLPAAYIRNDATQEGASWDMFREAVRYFAENEEDKFSFTGELDGIWSKSRWLEIGGKIVPGAYVDFSDTQFQPAGVLIRITAVKDYLNAPHKPEITLSNAPISGGFSTDIGNIEAEPVDNEAKRRADIRYTNRQWRDAKETMDMLQAAIEGFDGAIRPIAIETMQLLVGSENLQFRFVNNKTNPESVTVVPEFNTPAAGQITLPPAILQHMTLGIDSIKSAHGVDEYMFWDIEHEYVSPPLVPDKAYYIYAQCSKSEPLTGNFIASLDALEMDDGEGYNFLLGILNSENESGERSYAPLHGFSEILPGRITTGLIASGSGGLVIDLNNETIIANSLTIRKPDGGDEDVGERLDEIDAKRSLRVEKWATPGWETYREGVPYTATLGLWIFEDSENVTANINIARFVWSRQSDNPAGDLIWNSLHAHEGASIYISGDDLVGDTSFICDFYNEDGTQLITTETF